MTPRQAGRKPARSQVRWRARFKSPGDSADLAEELRFRGEYSRAKKILLAALARAETRSSPNNLEVASLLNRLGILYKHLARFREAEKVYRRALKIARHYSGAADDAGLLVADLYHNLGGLAHARGRYARGEPFARLAVRIREKALGPDHPMVAADRAALAAILNGCGKYPEAERLYRRALVCFRRVYGARHYEVAVILNNLGAIRAAKGDFAGAELMYRQAIAIKEKVLGRSHPELATTLNNLAVLEGKRGKHQRAKRTFLRAAAIFEKTLGRAHPSYKACRENYASLIRTMKLTRKVSARTSRRFS